MTKQGNSKRILASVVSLFFAFIGLIFSFLPFKFLYLPAALFPAIIAMLLSVYAVNITARFHLKKRLASISVIFSLIVLSLAISNIFFTKTKVKEDARFDAKNIQIQQEVEQSTDLQEALEEIDTTELQELIGEEIDMEELTEGLE